MSEIHKQNEIKKTEKTDILENFEIAKNIIKRLTGLELSVSEQVRLKEIVEENQKKNQQTMEGDMQIVPAKESVVNFLYEYYGIDVSSNRFDALFQREGSEKDREDIKEWFRSQQEEAHKI